MRGTKYIALLPDDAKNAKTINVSQLLLLIDL